MDCFDRPGCSDRRLGDCSDHHLEDCSERRLVDCFVRRLVDYSVQELRLQQAVVVALPLAVELEEDFELVVLAGLVSVADILVEEEEVVKLD